MSLPVSSQEFETYVPVYDTIPEAWEEAQPFLVEQLKKISNGVNAKTIGFLLDEELLSGQAFIPGVNNGTDSSGGSNQFRSVLRKVIDLGSLSMGLNAGVAHGIVFDANFTLIDLWVAATNSMTFMAQDISGNDVVMNATTIVVTSPAAFDRSFAFIEYCQEL